MNNRSAEENSNTTSAGEGEDSTDDEASTEQALDDESRGSESPRHEYTSQEDVDGDASSVGVASRSGRSDGSSETEAHGDESERDSDEVSREDTQMRKSFAVRVFKLGSEKRFTTMA